MPFDLMPFDYDTLVAGAGPAGCAAAYDLARAGRRVLLLDKRAFPRPKACACGLTRKTLRALRYSVDPVIERVCNEIVLQIGDTPGVPDLGSETWKSTNLPTADKSQEVRVRTRTPICAMAVRERFDDFCLRQTLAAGRNGGSAELLKIQAISALRELPAHVELDILTADGPRTLTALVLIGADGSNGQTRRLAARLHTSQANRGEAFSQSAQDGFALEATVAYAGLSATLPGGGAPRDLVFDFAPLAGGYGWLFPKGDHVNIGVGAFAPTTKPGAPGPDSRARAPHTAHLKQVTRSLLIDYARRKLGVGGLAHITGQHLGMGGQAYVPRGRVLLAGDAAGLVDPLTGEGIYSAIVSGQAAAAAILSCANAERPDRAPGSPAPASGRWDTVAAAYAANLRPLQEMLAFSRRAAHAFYAEPERGFKAMRLPIVRSLILKTYADGLAHNRLLTALAKLV